MIRINEGYTMLRGGYLFAEIERRVEAWRRANPQVDIIRLGIGDVTHALPQTVIEAFQAAVAELGDDASFRGYGPSEGYAFLREAIAQGDFRGRGVEVDPDEIFISDGAKCDSANFQELFASETIVAAPDPVYPVYVDANVMAGRTGRWHEGGYDGLVYLPSTVENRFVPAPPAERVDLVYLCFPNNPTGAVATREQLEAWVEWAGAERALILYDAAYTGYIRGEEIPRSIFEIEGARRVAVEFRSFSKTAGFTGTRCAYTIVPKECRAWDAAGAIHSLHDLWRRRCATKFNGVSYPVQRAAEATYSPEGRRQVNGRIDYYLENARLIRGSMESAGYRCTGGEHSPYVWVDAAGADDWELFERLLRETGVVTTPGSGFGRCGAGFLRISAFNHRQAIEQALQRITITNPA